MTSDPFEPPFCACRALAVGLGCAGAGRGRPAAAVLDRELFFGNPEIAGAQLSPDGQYIAFLKPWKDTRNIWVKKTDEPFEAARLRHGRDEAARSPASSGRRDSQPDPLRQGQRRRRELQRLGRRPRRAPKAEGKDVPPSRNLTDAKGARAFIYACPKKSPDTIYVGLNDRDAAWHDVYKVTISTGKRELVRKNTDRIAGWVFDLDGQLRLAVRTTDNGDTEILQVDAGRASRRSTPAACSRPAAPTASTRTASASTCRRTRATSTSPASCSSTPRPGKEELVESDPLKRVDFGGADLLRGDGRAGRDHATRTSGRASTSATRRWEADYKLLQGKFPGKDIDLGSSTADDRLVLITAASDTDPGERYLFDRDDEEADARSTRSASGSRASTWRR